MEENKNRRVEDLGCGDLKIIQDPSLYTFTSDSVILANFIKTKPSDRCLEIGMGSAVISILLSAKEKFKNIVGLEIQKEMACLAQENIALNNLESKISVKNVDAKEYRKHFLCGEFDVVFSNPPYMTSSTNKNKNICREIARHESYLPMNELTKVLSDSLRFGGKAYIVYGASRSAGLISSLIEHDLQPKTMFFTENGKGRVVLVVIEAVKGGKEGVTVLPNLITNDEKGDYYKKLNTRNFLNN